MKYAGSTAGIKYPVPSLGQSFASIATDFNAGQAAADKNKVQVTIQLSASDFVAPDTAYIGSVSQSASAVSSGTGAITGYAALRTMPFIPNKDATADTKELVV